MEAKNIRKIPITDKIFTRKDLDASYKAGEDKGKQEGFDKVVEFVNEHSFIDTSSRLWQAFLKER